MGFYKSLPEIYEQLAKYKNERKSLYLNQKRSRGV